MSASSTRAVRNNQIAAFLLLSAGGIYLYTMRHLKSNVPGDLGNMVRDIDLERKSPFRCELPRDLAPL